MIADIATTPTLEPPAPLAAHFATGEAIAVLLHPHAEVVLHNLQTGRIERIWNSFTDRRAGDPSNLNNPAEQFSDNQTILGPYEKALASQGRTKSITAGLRDPDGALIGFLCVNLDVTLFDRMATIITAFASPELKRPEPIYRGDVQQSVHYLARDYSLRVNKPIDRLSRDDRRELVGIIEREGLFQARNCVQIVAAAMQISRASVYNLLAELRDRPAQGAPIAP